MLPFALHAMLVLLFNLFNWISCRAKLSVFYYFLAPVEASKKLEISKSVEMTKESMRKSVLVESLKDSVVPAANIDRTLEEDVELENIKSDV